MDSGSPSCCHQFRPLKYVSVSSMICWRLPRPLAFLRFLMYDIGGLLFLFLRSNFSLKSCSHQICVLVSVCVAYSSLKLVLFDVSLSILFSKYVSRTTFLLTQLALFLLFLGSKLLNHISILA